MAANTQSQTEVAFTKPEMEHPKEAIITQCPRCHKEGEVRGLDLNDLKALSADVANALKAVNNGKQYAIVRMCANCRYRTSANSKPMSEAQKEARKRYNKQRQNRAKEALAMVAALTPEERAAWTEKYLADQAASVGLSTGS